MAKRYRKNKLEFILLDVIRFSTYFSFFTPLILSSNFFFPFVGPKSLFFMALAEIIFFSWIILISIEPQYRPKFNLLLLGLLIYLFVCILASVLGVNPSYSFWSKYERMTGILMHFHLFMFFLVLSSVFSEEDFKKFFVFSNFVAVLISIYALINLNNPSMRGGGTIGNESFLGTYLIFNCFFALYLVFKTEGFLRKISIASFFFLTLSLLLIGVHLENLSFFHKISSIFFSQGARAAKISFYGGLVLLLFLFLIASQKKVIKILGFILLISSIVFGIYASFSLIFQPEGILRKILEKEVGSFGGRFPVWQGAIKGFLERPWLGWGPENFEYSFIKYFNPCMGTPTCGGEIWFDRAHNIIFDTLISTGVLGMISYLLIFISSFFILWKNFLERKTDFWVAGIFISLFIAYFVQNLTVFDMVSSYLMFFVSLAFIASFEKKKILVTESRRPNRIFFTLVIFSFLISFSFFIILPLMTEATVISAIRSSSSNQRIFFYKKALSFSPLGKFQVRQFFAETAFNAFFSAPKINEDHKKELEFLIEELKKNVNECPLEFRSYLRLGQLLNFYSRFNPQKILEGEKFLRKAIELSPTNQQGYWHLSQNLLLQGKFEEAIFMAQKAVDLEPAYEVSHSVLISVAKMTGNSPLAKEKFEEAIKINPAWRENLVKILED